VWGIAIQNFTHRTQAGVVEMRGKPGQQCVGVLRVVVHAVVG
jgi:hypothetical protein